MGRFKPSKASGGRWRHRHKALYYTAVGAASGLDIAFAGLVAWNHFGLPAYLWVTTFAISVLEASTVVLSAVLIKMHVGRRSHADFGDALGPLWCGSLTINIAYLWGSNGEMTGSELYWQITAAVGALSQVAGITLVAMSYLYHVVSLRYVKQASAANDEEAISTADGDASGDEQASDSSIKPHKHRHHRRHH